MLDYRLWWYSQLGLPQARLFIYQVFFTSSTEYFGLESNRDVQSTGTGMAWSMVWSWYGVRRFEWDLLSDCFMFHERIRNDTHTYPPYRYHVMYTCYFIRGICVALCTTSKILRSIYLVLRTRNSLKCWISKWKKSTWYLVRRKKFRYDKRR